MKTAELMKIMGTSKLIKAARVLELKRYYMSLYRTYMLQLYEDCFISDPTRLNRVEITQNILNMNIVGMFDVVGRLVLTHDQVEFCIAKNKDGDEYCQRFLKLLSNALKFREHSTALDNFYDEQGIIIQNKGTKARMNPMIQGAYISNRGSTQFCVPIFECFSNFEDYVYRVDFNDYLWTLGMQELGIPEEDWNEDHLLDSSLTHEEEVKNLKGIFGGMCTVTGGKYTEALVGWLKDHRWGKNKTVENQKTLYDFLFYTYSFELQNFYFEKLNELLSQGTDVIGIADNCFYCKKPRTKLKLPIGRFALLCDGSSEYSLPAGNAVLGYTGELYSVDRLRIDGQQFVGCPIMLINTSGKYFLGYDIEQTDITGRTWFEYEDYSDAILGSGLEFLNISASCPEFTKDLYEKIRNNEGYGLVTVELNGRAELDAALNTIFKLIR